MTAASLVVVLGLIIPVISHVEVGLFDPLWHDRATIMMDSSISLQVQPTTLTKNGEWVTVTWEGVSSPSKKDWIGVYSPPANNAYGINATKNAPIKYQYAYYSSTHMNYGKGSIQIRLMNMRQSIIFGFFKGGTSSPALQAVSEVVQFSNPNEPLQGHLALTTDPTQMSLVWVTKDAVAPTVLWGTESGKYLQSSMAASGTYSATDMCGSPATDFGFRDPGLIHRATMNNLTPGQTYYYIFGDAYGWSSEYNFKAAPYPGSSDPVTIIAYGDMGCAELDDSYMAQTVKASLNTTKRIQEQLDKIDFVLQIGDISYALGYSSMWDVYFDQLEPIATRVPYMVGIGNHERNYPNTMPGYYNNSGSGGECGIPHELRFPMPTPALDEPWYGFDYGSAHVVIMSTEHQFTEGTPQYSYLENHLKSVNRKVTPWLIFGGHRPMYIASKDTGYPDGHNSVAYALRNSLEPLLKEYKVDLALWAHIHAYQRTCAVYQETCVDGGIPHVVIGMAGRNLANCLPSSLPSWLVYYDHKSYGYSRITVNTSTLVFEYIHSDDNVVYDTLVLQK
eukprot:Em0006g1015a